MQRDNTSPYHIAIFFHDLGIGGAERVMLQLGQGFIEAGHPVDLVLARAEGPLLSETPAGTRVIDFNTRKPFVMFVRLVKYLRAERPSALLSPFEVTSVIAILAKKISGASTRIVVRVSVHISRNKRTTKWKKILERLVVSRVYPLADGIITVSKGVTEDLSAYTGIPLERIKVIYNPVISEQLLQVAEHPVHHRFFAEGQYPVVLGVGRLAEQKDFSTLIRAFDILRKKIPSRLIILGDGEERPSLEELIRSCGLQDLVDLPGFDINPFAFMKKASVFVLSSKWEGLPGVLIQALACDCPVVSTDCLSGPSEILNGGEYGRLVPVGDVDEMAAAMEAVLIGNIRKPPKNWLEQFTIGAVIPQYKAVFGI
ncbi:MAG: glycosyltransferase [Anaerolineae bacterium]|nr:glycosyltransferase [Anaerolineae bacterium]MCI0608137.1 glycosyltransferase [Anaerolineae bacterium]